MHLTSACWRNSDRRDLTLAISQKFEFIIQIDQSLKLMLRCPSHLFLTHYMIQKIQYLRLQRIVRRTTLCEISPVLLQAVKTVT